MNNASLMIWRSSNLGLRAFVQNENLLSICSRVVLFKELGHTACPSPKRPLHSASTWAAQRPYSPGCSTSPRILIHDRYDEGVGGTLISKPAIKGMQNAVVGGYRFQSTWAKPPQGPGKSNLRDQHKQFIPLSRNKLAEIFGPGVVVQTGNNVLETLHRQRIQGTLDEEITAPGIDEAMVAKALAYLREAYPYDEDAAIMRRIEGEDRQDQAKYIQDAERLGIYQPQQNADPENVHGKSGLDMIKEHYENEATRRESDDPQAIASAPASPSSPMVKQPNGRAVLSRRSESAEWVKRYKQKAKLDGLKFNTLNSIQKASRIFPSAMFCLVVVWLCVLLAQNYVPPPKPARLWPDLPPAAATVIGIIGLNCVGLALWRAPPMWRFMNTFFLIIPARPRIWSMLGNVFSHQSPTHLFGNMLVLWFVGTRFHDDVGRGNFLAIYLSSGVMASLVSLSRFVITNNFITTSLGASGGLTGVLAAWCCMHAGEQFKIRFLPPEIGGIFSLNLLFFLLICGEIFGIVRGRHRIDHWAHLGGYATGWAGAMALKHRARRRTELEAERRERIGVGVRGQMRKVVGS